MPEPITRPCAESPEKAAGFVRILRAAALVAAALAAVLPCPLLRAAAAVQGTDGDDSAEGALTQGRDSLAGGDLPAALGLFRRALDVDPNLAAAHAGIGECLLRRGDPAGALGEFDAAVTLVPDFGEGHAGRARAYLAQGFREDALDEFTQAALDDPADSASRAERDRLAASLRKDPAHDWKDLRFRTFNVVWTTVADSYYDPTFGGVDWRAVRTRYRTRLESVPTPENLRVLLEDMVAELRRSHFAIIPREGAVFNPSERARVGSAGALVACIDDAPTIVDVRAGSPAALAGLRPGDSLSAIDGIDLQPITASLVRGGLPATRAGAYVAEFADSRLAGAVGTTVRLSVRAPGGAARAVALVCGPEAGPWSDPVGHFPSVPIRCETTRGADGIAVARFNVFALPVMQRMRGFLASLQPGDGLIIDLRGNQGGLSEMAPGLCGWLYDSGGSLGVIHLRNANQSLDIHPQTGRFTGPVAVLVDGESASTSEILAAGLQATGRARIFGEPTAGAALPSLFQSLPTGDLFQYAIAEATTPAGTVLEGQGIRPDEAIRRTRSDLAAGRDPVIEAARRWISGRRMAHVPPVDAARAAGAAPVAAGSGTRPDPVPAPPPAEVLSTPDWTPPAADAPDQTTDGPVFRILRRWIEAQGGYEAFFNFSSYAIDLTIDSGAKSGPLSEHVLRTGAGSLRYETAYPGTGTLIQAFDGRVGWQSNERLGFGLMSDAEVKRLTAQWEFAIGTQCLRSFRRDWLAGDGVAAGRPCSVIGMTLSPGTVDLWFFDKASGQLVRMSRQDSRSRITTASTDFSDFRQTGPITLPFMSRNTSAKGTVVIRWSRLQVNPSPDPSVFSLPDARMKELRLVDSILDRQRAGLGDRQALTDIRTRIIRSTVNNQISGLQSEVTTYRKDPRSFLIVTETAGLGHTAAAYDGTAGWSESELGGTYALAAADIAAGYSEVFFSSQGPAAAFHPLRRYLGERKLDGRPADVVALSDLQGPPETFYFDKKDARLLRITAALPGTGDETSRSLRFTYTRDYGDFRNVGSVQIPFLITETGPLSQIVTRVVSVADNVPLSDALFRPRPGTGPAASATAAPPAR